MNGDYLDTRIKNIPKELDRYSKQFDRLLKQVFDEFGLVICGWSAEWDTALRAAIERCPNQRFSSFWVAKSKPKETAQKLINLRRAQVITSDADSFFRELAEKVSALHNLAKPHPLSVKTGVATLKTYLMDDRHKIRLHDLVMQETEKVYGELSPQNFPVGGRFNKEDLINRVQLYEALTEALVAFIITGCYWGEKKHEEVWSKSLQRIANPSGEWSGLNVWLELRRYPALLLLYAGGIASVAAKRYGAFSALLTKVKVKDRSKEEPAGLSIHTWAVMDQSVGQQLPNMDRHYVLSMVTEKCTNFGH